MCTGVVSRSNPEWPKYLTPKPLSRGITEKVKCLPVTFRNKV